MKREKPSGLSPSPAKILLSQAFDAKIRYRSSDFLAYWRAVHKFFPKNPNVVELRFVRSTEMKKLNFHFRQKNRPTDVLSFNSLNKKLLGSIVIDLDVAKKQAKFYEHDLLTELRELFVHGLLHLLGFDHENAQDAEAMKSWELKILSQGTKRRSPRK